MKLRKMTAFLSAVLCGASVLTAFPAMNAKAVESVYNDFEVTYDGWHSNAENVQMVAESGKGYANSRGMTVTGRNSATDGASSSKGFYLIGGMSYNYSVKVHSETQETFHISVLTIDEETGEKTVKEIATKKVNANEWATISANYKAPANSYEFEITITTDSTNDFEFDEVRITSKHSINTVKAANGEKGLKDEFAPYFRVGNILNGGTVQNSAITANILKDCNSVECENETKPDATLVQSQCSGTNIGVSLNSCAAIMDFCVKNGIGMRGHTLVWHSQTPVWFFKEGFNANGAWVDKNTMDARMESYIKNMFTAIKTQYPTLDLYAYDVCNECISDDANRTANNGGAREPGDNNAPNQGGKSAWVQVYGDNSFVEKAFTYARKYAPEGCALYYNDYNEYWDHKRDCIYNMCKSLYQKGLLDGVGMQSHVPANATGFAGTDSYIEAMQKYLSIGCDVQITELDISVEGGKYSYTDQANKYKAIFQAAMDWNKNPKSDGRVTAVCIWGPNDANSWLKEGSNGLLYDKNNQPKEAYNALISMIPSSEWGDGTTEHGSGEVVVTPVEPNRYGWYFQHGFEGDLCDWNGRGAATIMTSGRTAFVGDEALLVQNREAAWNGAYYSLNPRAFIAGQEYSFSANVTYFDGDATDTFYLKLQYTDSTGKTQYSTIAEATCKQGKWVQLANTNYQIPEGASNMQIYVETADTTHNFYIDEVIGAVGGTGILGAKDEEENQPSNPSDNPSSKPTVVGDLNGDGVINVIDLALTKQGLINGFKSDSAKAAADVDQNGVVEVNDIILMVKYIHKEIQSFPIGEKVIPSVDVSKMQQIFAGVTAESSYKKDGENNPLYTQRFGADPGVMEYNGRVYVYMTNDVIEYDSNGNVKENGYGLVNQINCISSDDMVNWTDHGAIPVAGANGIAKFANNSWAPCAAHKTINGKEKFFLYFCNGGNGVCVLTADSPTGPWKDELGAPLVTRAVPNCGNIPWLFDPAVFVDKDGTGYLAFGGGVPEGKTAMPSTTRIVKLSDDMLHLDGTPVTIDAPYVFEDSGINRIGNKYYYTYCSNWNTGGNPYGLSTAGIEYMVADNPLGPYTYAGEVFNNQGNFFAGMTGNNHHSICELNGKQYLFYHSRPVEKAMGIDGNYRSPQVNEISMSGDKINSVVGTMTGVAQLKTLNPYQSNQAEAMSNQSKDISVTGLGDTVVNGKKGSWVKVSGVNFDKGTKSVTLKASSKSGCAVKICSGGTNGDVIGYVEIPAGGTTEVTAQTVMNISGTKDIYFVFSGDIAFDSWNFS